jgi:hypothetical protein
VEVSGRRDDLLKHYRAMGDEMEKHTAFVSGFKTNPVDAAFMNGP